jgi:hypothetical protein
MATLAELQAEERRAYRELQEAVAGLVEEVGERDAERVMQAVYDGLALGFADAMVELFPGEEWRPGRS